MELIWAIALAVTTTVAGTLFGYWWGYTGARRNL